MKGGTGTILKEEYKNKRSLKGKMWVMGRRKAMERLGNRYAHNSEERKMQTGKETQIKKGRKKRKKNGLTGIRRVYVYRRKGKRKKGKQKKSGDRKEMR